MSDSVDTAVVVKQKKNNNYCRIHVQLDLCADESGHPTAQLLAGRASTCNNRRAHLEHPVLCCSHQHVLMARAERQGRDCCCVPFKPEDATHTTSQGTSSFSRTQQLRADLRASCMGKEALHQVFWCSKDTRVQHVAELHRYWCSCKSQLCKQLRDVSRPHL
jgi:hypothetical protein